MIVVVITSTGGVSKQRYVFPEPVDVGLVQLGRRLPRASALTGTRLRSRLLARAFDEPSLSPRERAFLDAIRGAFDEVEDERQLYVGGAAGLLDDLRTEEIGAYRSLMDALEKRAALLDVLAHVVRPCAGRSRGSATSSSRPGLHDLALVGATYGLTNQTLGAVSLLGPLRMDYEKALRTVRAAAHELSRFVEEVYEAE